MKLTHVFIGTGLVAATQLIGCTAKTEQASKLEVPSKVSDLNQEEPCIVNSFYKQAVSEKCERGQKVVFLPMSWGNDQLPIMFAGLNCDLRYNVVSNNGGVTCIFIGKSKKEEAAEKAATASAASAPASSASSN